VTGIITWREGQVAAANVHGILTAASVVR